MRAQADGAIHWNGLLQFPLTVIYFIAATNRAPFDVVEREPKTASGFHAEHSGAKASQTLSPAHLQARSDRGRTGNAGR